jgi:hypothetical protein
VILLIPLANPGSIRSFEENAPVSYEPGTGADFMHKTGWNNRDAYGNPYRAAEFRSDSKERYGLFD